MKKNSWLITISIVAAIFLGGAFIAFRMIAENEKQKEVNSSRPAVYNPDDIIDESLVDPNLVGVSTGHKISGFKLVDQEGDTVTESIVEGKIFVADYFFTTCAGICPRMTSQLRRVQEAFHDEDDFVLLSHTSLPDKDTVSVMKAYAEKQKAVPKKWYFLTGDKSEILRMARQCYFVLKPSIAGQGDGGSDFVHTDQFVLVDKNREIRGYYNGTDRDDVNRLMKDIRFLLDHE